MASYDVAHIREQGQNMIIVFVDRSVGSKSKLEQTGIANSIEACACAAGLAGCVVLVWNDGFGRMAFFGPTPWHPFLRSVTFEYLAANINKRLTCG